MLARGSRHVHTGGALEPTDGAPHNLLSAGESNICAQPVTLYGSLSVLACPDTENRKTCGPSKGEEFAQWVRGRRNLKNHTHPHTEYIV